MMAVDPESQQVLMQFVQTMAAKRLQAPALLLLELHRPLRGCAYTAMQISYPLLSMLTGSTFSKTLRLILSTPELYDSVCESLRAAQEAA